MHKEVKTYNAKYASGIADNGYHKRAHTDTHTNIEVVLNEQRFRLLKRRHNTNNNIEVKRTEKTSRPIRKYRVNRYPLG